MLLLVTCTLISKQATLSILPWFTILTYNHCFSKTNPHLRGKQHSYQPRWFLAVERKDDHTLCSVYSTRTFVFNMPVSLCMQYWLTGTYSNPKYQISYAIKLGILKHYTDAGQVTMHTYHTYRLVFNSIVQWNEQICEQYIIKVQEICSQMLQVRLCSPP